MIGGGRPILRENLADTDPLLAKRRYSIYFRSWHLSRNTQQKVQLTLIGSPLRSFQ